MPPPPRARVLRARLLPSTQRRAAADSSTAAAPLAARGKIDTQWRSLLRHRPHGDGGRMRSLRHATCRQSHHIAPAQRGEGPQLGKPHKPRPSTGAMEVVVAAGEVARSRATRHRCSERRARPRELAHEGTICWSWRSQRPASRGLSTAAWRRGEPRRRRSRRCSAAVGGARREALCPTRGTDALPPPATPAVAARGRCGACHRRLQTPHVRYKFTRRTRGGCDGRCGGRSAAALNRRRLAPLGAATWETAGA